MCLTRRHLDPHGYDRGDKSQYPGCDEGWYVSEAGLYQSGYERTNGMTGQKANREYSDYCSKPAPGGEVHDHRVGHVVAFEDLAKVPTISGKIAAEIYGALHND